MKTPKIVALCGKPGSGKSTAAELLKEAYGYKIVDDGLPMRKMAMDYLGLTENQVFTQKGKLEMVTLNDRDFQVREVLGEIGNAFEEKFGGNIIPLMNLNRMKDDDHYVLGSVRREQGHFWAERGAMVIEIDNPDADLPKFAFDYYSAAAVQHTVLNDGLAEGMHENDALLRLLDRIGAVIEQN